MTDLKYKVKLHKIVCYVVDPECYSDEDTIATLENCKYLYPKVVEHTSKEIAWSDDHPLNKRVATSADLDEFLK